MIKAIAFLAALALCACQSCHPIVGPFPEPTPQPTPPDPWDGPGPDSPADASPPPPVTGASCADACAKLAALGCPEAKPTAKGATCVEVCQNTLGSPVSLQPDCVVHASDCPAAAACAAIPQ
jgi:hypothetical protein